MILIQVILIVAFLLLLTRFLVDPNSHQMKAGQKLITVLFFALAIFAVLFPGALNRIAHLVGVGRGADLLLYVLTLTFIFTIFSLYVRDKQNQRQVVALVRRIALIEANQNPHNRPRPKKRTFSEDNAGAG